MQVPAYDRTMKRSKVDGLEPPIDPGSAVKLMQYYTVNLGNHVAVYFTSERQALAFQAEATRWITDVVHESNLLLADAYQAYRLAWPLLSHGDHRLRDLFRQAEDALDVATNDRRGGNMTYWRWDNVRTALRCLRDMALQLHALYTQRTHAVPKLQMAVMLRRCNELAEAVRNYGSDVATSVAFRPKP